jgi:prevent-host-death family protein
MTPDTSTTPMRYSLKTLRRQLRTALAPVETRRERVVITRRGKPIAAVVPIDDLVLLTNMSIAVTRGVDRMIRAYAIEDALQKLCNQFFSSDSRTE